MPGKGLGACRMGIETSQLWPQPQKKVWKALEKIPALRLSLRLKAKLLQTSTELFHPKWSSNGADSLGSFKRTLEIQLTLPQLTLLLALLPPASPGSRRVEHPPLWKFHSPFEFANLPWGALQNGSETPSRGWEQTDRPSSPDGCLQMALKHRAMPDTSPHSRAGKAPALIAISSFCKEREGMWYQQGRRPSQQTSNPSSPNVDDFRY